MKRRTIYFQPMKIIMFSMVLLIFGCSKVKDGPTPRGEKISFKVNINNGKEKKATVHPTSSADFTTTFKVGDEIGVFAAAQGTNLVASGNPIHNAKLTYNGTGWDGDIAWPSGAANYDFYAYYPYQPDPSVENPLDPLQIHFYPSSINEGLNGFAKSDLMSGAVGSVVKGGDVELVLTHRLAMLQIEVSKGAGAGTGPDQSLEVSVTSNIGMAMLNLYNHSLLNINGNISYYLYRVEQPSSPDYSTKFTYRAYLPVHNLPNSKEIITLTSTAGTKKYLLPKVVQLRAGEAKIIKLEFLIE